MGHWRGSAFWSTVAIISAVVGIFFGAIAGYAGGFINSVIMRITDAFLAFPVIAGVVFIRQLVRHHDHGNGRDDLYLSSGR